MEHPTIPSTGFPCPVCGASHQHEIITIAQVPTLFCQFLGTREQAVAVRRGDLDIVRCLTCGHIYNRAFDLERVIYTADYENSLDFSEHHRRHTEQIVERLIESCDLYDKVIADIGCGRGEFLRLLCEHGGNHGIGYDPGQAEMPAHPVGTGSFQIVARGVAEFDQKADLICLRHVLEHLPSPVATLKMLWDLLLPGGSIYLEVPNAKLTINKSLAWDFIYDHVSYFTKESLTWALGEAGLVVSECREMFGEQYLCVQARSCPAMRRLPTGPVEQQNTTAHLRERLSQFLGGWSDQVAQGRRQGRRVALWGAGSKAVSFLNLIGVEAGSGVDYVVDINPRKKGRFVPGTGQLIVEPLFLREYLPDLVIIMNPEYRREIIALMRELDVRCQIVDATGHPFAEDLAMPLC